MDITKHVRGYEDGTGTEEPLPVAPSNIGISPGESLPEKTYSCTTDPNLPFSRSISSELLTPRTVNHRGHYDAAILEHKSISKPEPPIATLPLFTSRDSGVKRATSFFKRPRLQNTSRASCAGNPESKAMDLQAQHRIGSHPQAPSGSVTGQVKPLTRLTMQLPLEQRLSGNDTKTRSTTGFHLRDSLLKHKISFVPHNKSARLTSVEFESAMTEGADHAQLPPRQVWGMAAHKGVGLKSRRLSVSLPDDFTVDVVDLYSEFSDQSRLVGRRGKSVGKGATAHVRLMNRKGGCASEVYAVKEFRGKSSKEKIEEYEKKVKSEYLIAKSVHHPNIVESIRLCTHNGRWNHVMEFCDQGDLFSLVSQKYLSKEERLFDRLCLFKQLVQGLDYLHTRGIAHRDVKLENILITRNSKLKITDFGVSEVFCGIHPGLRSAGGQCGKGMGEVRLCDPGMCGSPPYVAPEVVEKKYKYDPRPLDVWGAAVVMLCVTANGCLWQEAKLGNSPQYDDLVEGWTKWNAKHTNETDMIVNETDYPHVPFFNQHINPPTLRRLLLTMLNPNPAKRASIGAVVNNRWLKNVECCQIASYSDPAQVIDASQSNLSKKGVVKIVHHNHLPPAHRSGHRLVRLPGTDNV